MQAEIWQYREAAKEFASVPEAVHQMIIDAQIERFRESYKLYFERPETVHFVQFFFERIYSLEDKRERDRLAYQSVARVRNTVSKNIRTKLDCVLRLNDITDYLDLKMGQALLDRGWQNKSELNQDEYELLYKEVGTRSERKMQLELLFENFTTFYRYSRKPMLRLLLPPIRFVAKAVGAMVLYRIFAQAYESSRTVTPDLFDPFFELVQTTESAYLDRLLPG